MSGLASTGKKTCTMEPARAQTRNTTSNISAKTISAPKRRTPASRKRPESGSLLAFQLGTDRIQSQAEHGSDEHEARQGSEQKPVAAEAKGDKRHDETERCTEDTVAKAE